MKQNKILIIDDEPQIRKMLKIILDAHHYKTFEAENGKTGLYEVAMRHPDAVILDLGLPDMDGLEVLKQLREWTELPILILTVKSDSKEKVSGLDLGADDYVTKPFDSEELLARLRVILRRKKESVCKTVFEKRPLKIDFESHRIWVNKKELTLTSTEFGLIRALSLNEGKILTHRQLFQEVWGPQMEFQPQYLRVYMVHLRKKIEDAGVRNLIRTETGIGYRLLFP